MRKKLGYSFDVKNCVLSIYETSRAFWALFVIVIYDSVLMVWVDQKSCFWIRNLALWIRNRAGKYSQSAVGLVISLVFVSTIIRGSLIQFSARLKDASSGNYLQLYFPLYFLRAGPAYFSQIKWYRESDPENKGTGPINRPILMILYNTYFGAMDTKLHVWQIHYFIDVVTK